MTDYRRIYIPGSTWFFTVNLTERRNNHLLVDRIDLLREAFRYVKHRKRFRMEAVVTHRIPDTPRAMGCASFLGASYGPAAHGSH